MLVNNSGMVYLAGSELRELKKIIIGVLEVATSNKLELVCFNTDKDIKKVIPTQQRETYFLDIDGNFYCSGIDFCDTLGHPTEDICVYTPKKIYHPRKIIDISCGHCYSMVIDDENNLYIIGIFNFTTFNSLELHTNIKVKNISCGSEHAFIRSCDNNIFCRGANTSGQLGLGDTVDRYEWTKFNYDIDIVDIKCGYLHTILLNKNGDVYSFGANTTKELGLGDIILCNIPTKVDVKNVVKISLVHCHNLLLDDNSIVYGFGWNETGQLGLGNSVNVNKPTKIGDLPFIVDINALYEESYFLDIDGVVWTCGYNLSYDLGFEHNNPVLKPKKNLSIIGVHSFEDYYSRRDIKSARKI